MCRSSAGDAEAVVNQFCFVSGTQTFTQTFTLAGSTSERPDSLRNVVLDRIPDPEEDPSYKKTHGWYQWVPFLLCFQGFLFLIPHNIWTWLEENRMTSISNAVLIANR